MYDYNGVKVKNEEVELSTEDYKKITDFDRDLQSGFQHEKWPVILDKKAKSVGELTHRKFISFWNKSMEEVAAGRKKYTTLKVQGEKLLTPRICQEAPLERRCLVLSSAQVRLLFIIISLLLVFGAGAQPLPVGTILPKEQTSVHDPVIIKQDSMYYIFCTGNGIDFWSSIDLQQWKKEAPVFAKPPQWAVDAVPGFKEHIWAPDIQYFNGKYYLFYSISQFGKNTSCIGVAVNKTLHPSSPDYRWKDLGKVVQSVPGRDLWNAIDPNMITDEQGKPWLSFGSWWSGIKLVRLDSAMKVAEPQQWYTIARRPRDYNSADFAAGNNGIEAPFIFKKGDYYYLFLSFDLCCQGEQSTYKIVVGRSKKLQGPYLDKAGVRLDSNGGSLLLQGNADWYGVGHNAVYSVDGKDLLVFHGYDAKDKARPKLRIKEFVWDREGWPEVKEGQRPGW